MSSRLRLVVVAAFVCLAVGGCRADAPRPPEAVLPARAEASAAASVGPAASVVAADPSPPGSSEGSLPASALPPRNLVWIGANAQEASLRFSVLGRRDGRTVEDDDYFTQVDLSTGCVTRSYHDLDKVWMASHLAPRGSPSTSARGATDDDPALTELHGPAFQKQWHGLTAFLGPDRADPYGTFAIGADPKHVAMHAVDFVYLSSDGGTTFRRLDTVASYAPRFAPRGPAVAFRDYLRPKGGDHHYEVAVGNGADPAAPLAHLGPHTPRDFFFSRDGRLLFVSAYRQHDHQACLHRVDLQSKLGTALFCASSFETAMSFSGSPNGTFGLLRTRAFRPPTDPASPAPPPSESTLHVIDLTSGKIVGRRTSSRGGEGVVDDDGKLAWTTYPEASAASSPIPSTWLALDPRDDRSDRDLGRGIVLGWAPGNRLVIGDDRRLDSSPMFGPAVGGPHPAPKPSRDRCGWVRVVSVETR